MSAGICAAILQRFTHKSKVSLTVEFDNAVGFSEGILSDTFVEAEVLLGYVPYLQHHKFIVAAVHGERLILATYNFHFCLNVKPLHRTNTIATWAFRYILFF